MDDLSVNDDDDHEEEEDWDGVNSSTCSKQTPRFYSPSVNKNDDEEDYYEDEDDDYDYDDDEEEDNENEDDDDGNCEFGCPYCTENFDVLGLCCHIDNQHYKEAKSGICPICAKELETSMTVHVITQHENFLRALRRKKFRSRRTHMDISLLKKEKHSLAQLQASSRIDPSYDLSSDLLLLSFVRNSKPAHQHETVRAGSVAEACLSENSSSGDIEERISELPPPVLTDKLQDKAQVCEFVKGLLFSTIFDHGS